MAQIKLDFKGLSDLGIIQKCTNIKTALTGNATFPTTTPTLAAFGTLITTAQTKLTASDMAQQTSKLATSDKDAAITALLAGVNTLGAYVSMTAGGDAVKIQSAGFSIKATSAPASVPDQVQNLSLTAGDNAGELDAQWDSMDNSKSFEIQTSPDPMTATSFVSADMVTKSSAALTGFTSGAKIWARVRAINSAGKGAWSDPAVKIAP